MLAEATGVEPILTQSKCVALPLGYAPISNVYNNFKRLRTWPSVITSYTVGDVCSHCRLNSSYQSHQFQWLLANSYLELHRFHFITFCLADFTDCGLLELQLLLLSHILPCELYMCSYYRTISDFSVSKSYTLLLYSLSLINSSFPI